MLPKRSLREETALVPGRGACAGIGRRPRRHRRAAEGAMPSGGWGQGGASCPDSEGSGSSGCGFLPRCGCLQRPVRPLPRIALRCRAGTSPVLPAASPWQHCEGGCQTRIACCRGRVRSATGSTAENCGRGTAPEGVAGISLPFGVAEGGTGSPPRGREACAVLAIGSLPDHRRLDLLRRSIRNRLPPRP